MSNGTIHRVEGTNSVVYCPVEGTYIPALEMDQATSPAKILVIEEETPHFKTLAEAWQWQLHFALQSVATRHNQVDAEYAEALAVLKKKVSSLHVKVIDGIFNG